MNLLTRLLLSLVLLVSPLAAFAAGSLTIAAGAGYRKPLLELIERFRAETGITVDGSFGNLKQVETQARQSDAIVLVVGDRAILEPTGIAARYHSLGKGRLALIAAPGRTIRSIQDLASAQVRRVGIPNRKSAIFGKAAAACIERLGMEAAIAPKLVEVSTVPQVVTYTLTGEVDAGFVNLTEALAQEGRIGSRVEMPAACYDPIDIAVGEVVGRTLGAEARRFLDYLLSPAARAILERHGL